MLKFITEVRKYLLTVVALIITMPLFAAKPQKHPDFSGAGYDFKIGDNGYYIPTNNDDLIVPIVYVCSPSKSQPSRFVTHDGIRYRVAGLNVCIPGKSMFNPIGTLDNSELYLYNWYECARVSLTITGLHNIFVPSVDWWLMRYNNNADIYSSDGNSTGDDYLVSHVINHYEFDRDRMAGGNEPWWPGYYETVNLFVIDENSKEYLPTNEIKIPYRMGVYDLTGSLENFGNIESIDLSEIDILKTGISCRNLHGLKSAVLSDNLTEIHDEMFANCINMSEYIVPQQICKIGNMAFSALNPAVYHDNYKAKFIKLSKIDLPTALQSVGRYAFAATSVKELVFGNNVKELGELVCYNCRQLENVEIGDGVEEIKGVFYSKMFKDSYFPYEDEDSWSDKHCENMNVTKIRLGSRVSLIGEKEFSHMPLLNTVECLNPMPPVCEGEATVFNEYTLNNGILYVRKGSKAAYEADGQWGQFAEIRETDFPDISPIAALEQTSFILTSGENARVTPIIDGQAETLAYTSSDPSVAMVAADGTITAGKLGQTIISVIPDGREDLALQAVVNVVEPEKPIAEGISIEGPDEMETGQTKKLDVLISPTDCPYTEVKWKSRDPRLAFVDLEGNVTAQRPGTVIIEAYTMDGSDLVCEHSINITGEAGIDEVNSASEVKEVILYDLQGRRVHNPQTGLYIMVSGSKASKILMTE